MTYSICNATAYFPAQSETPPLGTPAPFIPTGSDPRFGNNTSLAVAGTGRTCTVGEIILNAGVIANGTPAAGQTVPINSDTALFSVLGTIYGGDGTTNFQLPDLRAAAPNGLTYSICAFGIFPSGN